MAVLYWSFADDRLPLRRLSVDTAVAPHTASVVEEVLRSLLGQPFFGIGVGDVRARLEALPWVREASVRRIWPDGLVVSVQEQEPLAKWGDTQLLSVDGELFEPDPRSLPPALPGLSGPDGLHLNVLASYRTMRDLLAAGGLRVQVLRLDERRAWSLILSSGVRIELGREYPIRRLQRLLRVFAGQLYEGGDEIERVDARYTNGFAVRRRAGSDKEQTDSMQLQGAA